MDKLQRLLAEASALHSHLCPRQVLGVRMGLLAGDILGIDVPQTGKRLFTFAESDGCGMGGIATATGCYVRRRSMRIMDYGKVAATFVDRATDRAIRIVPHPQSRQRALSAPSDEPDRWQRQLLAYQQLPAKDLFVVTSVQLTVSLEALISQPGLCVYCDVCGEEITNGREVEQQEHTLCRACAGEGYYQLPDLPTQALPSHQERSTIGYSNHYHHR